MKHKRRYLILLYNLLLNVTKIISRLCTHANQNHLKQMLLKQYLDCVHIDNQNQLKQMLLKQYLECVHIENQNQLKQMLLKQYLDRLYTY